MQWTTERPTTVGFYWWRKPGYTPRVTHVRLEWRHAPGQKKPCPIEQGELWIPYNDGEWAGPISLPEEPSTIIAHGNPDDRISLQELERHWAVNEPGEDR